MFGIAFFRTYLVSYGIAYICGNVDLPNCQAGGYAYWVSNKRSNVPATHKDEPTDHEPPDNRSSRKSTQQGTYVSTDEYANGGNDSI